MIAPDDLNNEDSEGENGRSREDPRLTRSQQTRAATEVNRLGLELTKLSAAELDRLDLPERVREAVDTCQKLKVRSRGRQNRLIGQLLRAEDYDVIRGRVESSKDRDRAGVQQEKQIEDWRDRIVEEGDPAVEDLMKEYPRADRQRLRLLSRNARKNPKNKNAKRARLELLRAIRALRS